MPNECCAVQGIDWRKGHDSFCNGRQERIATEVGRWAGVARGRWWWGGRRGRGRGGRAASFGSSVGHFGGGEKGAKNII